MPVHVSVDASLPPRLIRTALVKDLAQSAPKPINSHFQAAVIRRDGWLDDSFLFSTSLLRQDPARDLLTSSWSREASVQGRVALGSSPLSLKWRLAPTISFLREDQRGKHTKVAVGVWENRLFLK